MIKNYFVRSGLYKEDYSEITTYFQNQPVSYESAIETVRTVAESGRFE